MMQAYIVSHCPRTLMMNCPGFRDQLPILLVAIKVLNVIQQRKPFDTPKLIILH